MSERLLYAIPTDDETPYPVSLDRIFRTLAALGHQSQVINDKTTIGLVVKNHSFIICLDSSYRYFSIRCQWDTNRNFDEAEDLFFSACDTWNREHYFPTVYTTKTATGSCQVVSDFLVNCREGLSENQLKNYLHVGISTGIASSEHMKSANEAIENLDTAELALASLIELDLSDGDFTFE